MSASYPNAAKIFATRSAGDVLQPAHVNEHQERI